MSSGHITWRVAKWSCLALLLLWGASGVAGSTYAQDQAAAPSNLEWFDGNTNPNELQFGWDNDPNFSFWDHIIHVTREEPLTPGGSSAECSAGGTAWVRFRIRQPNNQPWDGLDGRSNCEVIAGEAYSIEIVGIYGMRQETARSEAFVFGSHPAPEVQADYRTSGPAIWVNWQPTGVANRGGSAVRWEVTAVPDGDESKRVQRTVDDPGTPNETNPGQILLPVPSGPQIWTVRIRSRNQAKWGVTGRTAVLPDPAGPTDVTATVRSDHRVRIRWAAPANVATDPVDEYELQRWSEADNEWQSLDLPMVVDGEAFVAEDRGVSRAREQAYSYRVLSLRPPPNEESDSVVSASAPATTDPTVPVPVEPAALDLNLDGRVNSTDAVILYYYLTIPNLTVEATAESYAGRRFLRHLMLGTNVMPNEQQFQSWLTRAQHWVAVEGILHGTDFDHFGSNNNAGITANDAVILYYVLEFQQLLGDGQANSGMAGIRNRLIGARLGSINLPQVMERARQIVTVARDLHY